MLNSSIAVLTPLLGLTYGVQSQTFCLNKQTSYLLKILCPDPLQERT